MQLMWVSGPTGSVRSISITARKSIAGVCAFTSLLLFLGMLLHFVGFRLALELRPSLAHSMGGITSEAEQRKTESVYRDQLNQLRQAMVVTLKEIRQLESLKDNFMRLATPAAMRGKYSAQEGGQGGPWVAPPSLEGAENSLQHDFSQAMDEFAQTASSLKALTPQWTSQLIWVDGLPTGLPVAPPFRLTSPYGTRADPFTGKWAMHEGIDFAAPAQTPVRASAAGTVTRSTWDDVYGNVIEISHQHAFATRYAHLNRRLVQQGQTVLREEQIAELGNTGRSTGPHLHFEVMQHGRLLNPAQVLPIDN